MFRIWSTVSGSTRRVPYITLSAGVTWDAADVDAGGGKFAVLLLLGPVQSSCGCCTGLGGGGMTFARASAVAISGPFPLSSTIGGAWPGWSSSITVLMVTNTPRDM